MGLHGYRTSAPLTGGRGSIQNDRVSLLVTHLIGLISEIYKDLNTESQNKRKQTNKTQNGPETQTKKYLKKFSSFLAIREM